uniref:Zinc finger BED domain-containing protein 1 n=1 Tax=Lygus hesperus TaxID=30085 RepID=A0A146KPU4_LYGHE
MCVSLSCKQLEIATVENLFVTVEDDSFLKFIDKCSHISNTQVVHRDPKMLKLVLQKLHKRYIPESNFTTDLGSGPQMRQRQCDVRGAVNCHELLVKCTFLDPRFRPNLTEADQTTVQTKLVKEFCDEQAASQAGTSTLATPLPPAKKQKAGLASVFAKLSGQNVDQGGVEIETPERRFRNELARYNALPPVFIDDDILVWWRDHSLSFPCVSKLAKKYLCAVATSTPSERVFSAGGRVITDQRTCLTGEHADQLIFLSMNKKTVPRPK